jgi:hypothetical protein
MAHDVGIRVPRGHSRIPALSRPVPFAGSRLPGSVPRTATSTVDSLPPAAQLVSAWRVWPSVLCFGVAPRLSGRWH